MKIAVITGASSGIGLETKKMLEKFDYLVVDLSRNGSGENSIHCDVSKEEDVINAFKIIAEKYGKVDLLINNAGYGISGAMELIPSEKARNIFEVNVFGVLYCFKHCLPLMEKNSKIINIASAMALFPLPFRGLYASSKSAVLMMSDCLRMECGDFGVKVCSVCPGDVKTNFTKNRVKIYETNERYGNRIQSAADGVDSREDIRMSPDKVAKTIVKLVKKKNPKPTTIVGFKYKVLYVLTKFFPKRMVLGVIGKFFGGKK